MNRKEKIKKILDYTTKKPFKGKGYRGQKKNVTCPHCGSRSYEFYSRYKHCTNCGYDTLGERKLSWIKWHLKRDRDAEISGTDLEMCVRYIEGICR